MEVEIGLQCSVRNVRPALFDVEAGLAVDIHLQAVNRFADVLGPAALVI